MMTLATVGSLQRKRSALSKTRINIHPGKKKEVSKKVEPLKSDEVADKFSSDLAKKYTAVARQCKRLVESDTFNFGVIIAIIIAGVNVGLQTYSVFETNKVIETLDKAVLSVFGLEILLKILAEAWAPWKFLTGPERAWNIFDLVIVVLSMPFWGSRFGGNSIKLLRLTRLMRVMRLVKKIPQLELIVMGLVGGLKSIIYILALLGLVFYIYAIIGVTLFHQNDPFHFRSVPVSFVTLFRMATLDDWTDVLYLNYYGCDSDMFDTAYLAVAYPHRCKMGMKDELRNRRGITVIYFVSFIVTASLVMLSLFVGAVTMSMTESMAAMKWESESSERKRRLEKAKKRAEKERESRCAQKNGLHRMNRLESVQDEKLKHTEPDHLKVAPSDNAFASNHRMTSPAQHCAKEKSRVEDVLDRFGFKRKRFAYVHPANQVEKFRGDKFKNLAAKALKTIHKKRRSSFFWNPFSTASESREDQIRVRAALKGAWQGIDLLEVLDEGEELEYDKFYKKKWARLSKLCNSISSSLYFQNLMVCVILIASVLLGLQTELQVQEKSEDNETLGFILSTLDWIVLSIFIFEILLKVIGERFRPWRYFLRGGRVQAWNIFDYLVVILSLIPGGSLRMFNMLRLLRLLRVFKLVRSLPALQVIIVALISGFNSISYIGIILFLVFYVFAIMGMILFQESDPWHFSSLHISMFTLFRMATLEDWSEVLYISMYGCNRYGYFGNEGACKAPTAYGAGSAIFFISFILLGNLVLISLFVGVVTTSMEQATQKQASDREFADKLNHLKEKFEISEKLMDVYEKLFNLLDVDGSGTIEEEELKLGLESIGRCPDPADLSRMVKLVDEDGSGEIDLIEFVVLLSILSKFNGGK